MHSSFLRRLPAAALVLLAACGGDDPSPTSATVSGVVRTEATGAPLAGAVVTIGTASATSGPDGAYALPDVRLGSTVTITATLAGYDDYRAQIAVGEDGTTHDIALGIQSIFVSRDVALLVPRDLAAVRAVLVLFGGPDTRAVATGDEEGLSPQERETVRKIRSWYGTLAAAVPGLAVMGTVSALPDLLDTDVRILDALADAAAASGRAELAGAPILLQGISGGGPAAFGFARRQPDRTVAFLLRAPRAPAALADAAALPLPGYLVLAGSDTVVDNDATRAFFDASRAQGARWGLAVEPGTGHFGISAGALEHMRLWSLWALEARLRPGSPSTPLAEVAEESGWLGDLETGTIGAWGTYAGDRTRASWLPTPALAGAWRTFAGFAN